ncbi:MAG: hypothetical protein A2605_03710 [Candidatus Zambryskibacteria bacterium RIFOXYD1_FULL_39_35]|nr:MAG: hypothetical protein A2605_03710 [Candidatus Zambryskibacteria bacterium RIFOXYD1_FULL_39_35]
MQGRRYNKASSRIAKRNNARRVFGLVLKVGLPIIFLIGIIFILRADFLQIKNIVVLGAETVSTENLKATALSRTSGDHFFIIPKTNILFLNKQELADTLLTTFPRLEKAEINKQYFSKSIVLKVLEREADFLWCASSEECFYMNKSGLIFEKAETLSDKFIFKGGVTGDPIMQSFATAGKIQNYLKFIDVFEKAGFEATYINIESSDKAILGTSIGEVFFSPGEADLALIAQNALLLIDEIKSNNLDATFEYIDARFGNKMFYKLK